MYSSANDLMTKEQFHIQATETPNRGSVKVEELMTFEKKHFGGLKIPFLSVSRTLKKLIFRPSKFRKEALLMLDTYGYRTSCNLRNST